MRTPEPVVLAGHGVVLEPMRVEHAAGLLAVVDEDVWRWLSVPQPRSTEEMTAVVEAAVADPDRVPFTVVVDGTPVGSTSYLDLDPHVGGLEIGWTWYARRVWGTSVNPACKLLLLQHAFEDLGAGRVHFKADALNTRSCAAIRKLGAQYDGTLRHHRRRPDGSIRDSAYFSVLAAEWPDVRDGLLARLG